MKDIYQVFDENLGILAKFINESSFRNCFRIAVDLNRISIYSDFRRGVLIAKVLEGIFSQVGPLKQYAIPDADKKQIKDTFGQNIVLLSTYKNDDKEKMYEILEGLRFTATAFQFKCGNNWKQKKEDSDVSRAIRESGL